MSVNIGKMNYHHDRAKILARALKRSEGSPDGKMDVDLDGNGKVMRMTRSEIQAQYDRETAAGRDAGSRWGD